MGQRPWDGARLACAALVLALQLPTYRGASLEWSVWDNGQAEPEPAPPTWSADPEEIEGPERRGLLGAQTVITVRCRAAARDAPSGCPAGGLGGLSPPAPRHLKRPEHPRRAHAAGV